MKLIFFIIMLANGYFWAAYGFSGNAFVCGVFAALIAQELILEEK